MKRTASKEKQDPIIFYTYLRFLLTILFLGFFACYNFFVLDSELHKASKSAALVRFMENQRSLVQQSSFSAIAYAQSIEVEDRKTFREDVRNTLQALLFFNTTSNDIMAEKTGLSLPWVRELREIYFSSGGSLNNQVNDYISIIKKFLLSTPVRLSSNSPQIISLKNESSKLISSLSSAAGTFQEENERKLVLTHRVSLLLFALNIVCLALVGVFVFYPLVKKIALYLSQLKTVTTALEIKVAERTADLEQKASELTSSNEALRNQVEIREKTEQELLKANAFLDSIIENIPNMLFIKDAEELRFVRFNRAGEELLGRQRHELIGNNDYSFFPKDQADFFTQKDRDTLNSKGLLDIPEEPIQTQNKGLRILHTKKIPILDTKGSPAYLLGISEDITERIRSEELLRELSLAMENALDGIARLDPNMKFLSVNKAYALMSGYSPEEMVGLNQLTVICPEDHDKLTAIFKDMQETGKAEAEIKSLRKDGLIFHQYVVLVRAPDKNDLFTGFYCFAQDVTERKYKEALEIKSELIQMVSHELRTPIHSVKEGLSIVLEGLTGEITEEQKEILSISKRCIDRLVRLVNNVLAFHKFEAGVIEFNMKKASINQLLREVFESMLPLAKDKGLFLKLQIQEDLPEVEMDRDKIAQVVTNFLQNAINFTPQGGINVISGISHDLVKVSIQDTGIGIKDEDLAKIFRKFGQIEAAKLVAPGGTGLGLAISKKIIERHYGKIEVVSEYKKGCCFSFILPVTQPQPPPSTLR